MTKEQYINFMDNLKRENKIKDKNGFFHCFSLFGKGYGWEYTIFASEDDWEPVKRYSSLDDSTMAEYIKKIELN